MKTIYLNLDIAEIIYDIQNKTYLTGKSRSDGSNYEQVANMQANDDDENANQVLRSVSMAYSNLKTKLGEYLEDLDTTATNELVKATEPLSLKLSMPSNFNTSTIETMAASAHQYIVSKAVADWFTITHKTDAPEYSALADASLKIITEAVNKRRRPSRPSSDNA